MRRADIKPGEIYAYQRSKYSSPEECIFLTPLTPDHLYEVNKLRRPADPWFKLDTTASRPMKSNFYGNTGWLVAIGRNVLHASREEAVSTTDLFSERGYHYTVLVSLAKVTGVYTEVVAAAKAEREREKEARRVAQEANDALSRKFLLLQAKLLADGIDIDLLASHGGVWIGSERNLTASPPRGFTMTYDQAIGLADLIDAMNNRIKHLEG